MYALKKTNSPLLALRCFLQGVQLLAKPQLRKFIIIPMLISLLLYSIAFILAYFYLNALVDSFIPAWLHWLSWLLFPSLFLGILLVGFFTFTLLANIISSPFYGHLSAQTQRIINPQAVIAAEQPLIKVLRAELVRIGYVLTRSLPLLILFIIPVVNVIAPVLWALFSAWSLALEYMAYPLENDGILFAEQKKLLASVRLETLSFGGLAMLGLSVPLINVVVAPAAVIGATLYCNAIRNEQNAN